MRLDIWLLVVAVVSRAAWVPLAHGQTTPARRGIDTSEAIRVARETFQESERAVTAHRWVRSDTTVECNGGFELDVIQHRDSAGTVRYLEWSGGSDDHAETHRYFYDARGRLRFAFRTLGAVNGTEAEERVYYAEGGEVVRRLKRLVKGPGYPAYPERGLPDPAAWRALCG